MQPAAVAGEVEAPGRPWCRRRCRSPARRRTAARPTRHAASMPRAVEACGAAGPRPSAIGRCCPVQTIRISMAPSVVSHLGPLGRLQRSPPTTDRATGRTHRGIRPAAPGDLMADGLDPRTPVLIGAGQLSQRVDHGARRSLEPVDLMAEALRRAEADSGVDRRPGPGRLGPRASASSRGATATPARWSAERVGAAPRQTALHGHGRQLRADGGEPDRGRHPGRAGRRRARHRRRGVAVAHRGPAGGRPTLDWTRQPEGTRAHRARWASTTRRCPRPARSTAGVFLPVHVYPMFEVALRAKAGPQPSTSSAGTPPRCGRASARWRPRTRTPGSSAPTRADEIATATPDNRMIGYPYTKLHELEQQRRAGRRA